MKAKRYCILFFSLLLLGIFSGQEKKDSLVEVKRDHRYQPKFILGVDVLHLGLSYSSDQKITEGSFSFPLRKKLHILTISGFEKNDYKKNRYDTSVDGYFLKLGVFYMLVIDPENLQNGFYIGAQLASSFYDQEYRKIPVFGHHGEDVSASFPKSSQSSYWIDGIIGGRVNLFRTNIFFDIRLQPRYLAYTTKQENISPMIIPGFGLSAKKLNIGFSWNIAYLF